MPCHTCCIEEGGAAVTFCRVKWKLVIGGLLRSAPKAGSRDAHRLLLGGSCSLVVQTQGALGGLGRVACPWPWAAPFPAAVVLAAMLAQLRCQRPFPLFGSGLSGAQISPWPEVGSERPTVRAHPSVLSTFHLHLRSGHLCFFWWFVWCWERFENRIPSNLGSEFTSLSPRLLRGEGREKREGQGNADVIRKWRHAWPGLLFCTSFAFATVISEAKPMWTCLGLRRILHTFLRKPSRY